MPLHLLSKKSWNVYNADNIARVRRDEEQARKQEAEEEMRMQQDDAERRILELRRRAAERQGKTGGEVLGNKHDGASFRGESPKFESASQPDGSHRGQTKLAPVGGKPGGYTGHSSVSSDVHKLLSDKAGNINLFAEPVTGPRKLSSHDKNQEYEKEKAAQEAKVAAQYNVALGKPAEELRPWYTSLDKVGEKQERKMEYELARAKRRDERTKDRNDPMALIKKSVKQLKQVEQSRVKEVEERRREIEILREEQMELESFSLDGTPAIDRDRASGGSRHHHGVRDRKHRDRERHSRKRGRSRSRDFRGDRDKAKSSRRRSRERSRHRHQPDKRRRTDRSRDRQRH